MKRQCNHAKAVYLVFVVKFDQIEICCIIQTRFKYCFLALPNNLSENTGLSNNLSENSGLSKSGKMILQGRENGEVRVNVYNLESANSILRSNKRLLLLAVKAIVVRETICSFYTCN